LYKHLFNYNIKSPTPTNIIFFPITPIPPYVYSLSLPFSAIVLSRCMLLIYFLVHDIPFVKLSTQPSSFSALFFPMVNSSILTFNLSLIYILCFFQPPIRFLYSSWPSCSFSICLSIFFPSFHCD